MNTPLPRATVDITLLQLGCQPLDMSETREAPNGRRGWLVVASAHVAIMMWDRDTKALAVLLPTLKEQFNAETWMIGWLIAGVSTVLELTGTVVIYTKANK